MHRPLTWPVFYVNLVLQHNKGTNMNLKMIETKFRAQFPKAWCRVGEFLEGHEDTLWTGEDCFTADGSPLYDPYWHTDNNGLHPLMEKFAESIGCYWECYDSGTVYLVKEW
jgi:hypothetical protein